MPTQIAIEQHTGIPFIIMQHMHPGIIMHDIMQSQHAWIIFSHLGSPLVQVIFIPMSIISILHVPIIPHMHEHIIMPFIMQPIEHIPPCIIMHICCIIVADAWSSAVHVTIIPPGHFSIFMVQRGAIMPGIIPPIIEGIVMGDIADIGDIIEPIPPPIMGIIEEPIIGIIPPIMLPMPPVIPRPLIVEVIGILLLRVRDSSLRSLPMHRTFPTP